MHATSSAVGSPKGYKSVGMEGFIATWYARLTAKDMEARRAADTRQNLPLG
jgi:hypothetical protein